MGPSIGEHDTNKRAAGLLLRRLVDLEDGLRATDDAQPGTAVPHTAVAHGAEDAQPEAWAEQGSPVGDAQPGTAVPHKLSAAG
ncbi:MAG: hypothetical protein HY873_09550 [Chloroflexi bacterium]|nr:hypothetical protein [Chloroflexota bacterium]